MLIPAYAYDRGLNVVTDTNLYADPEPLVGNRHWPTEIEYDVDFPVDAQYTLHIRYAAATARPIEILLDGKSLGLGCRQATGGWNTSQAAWEETCRVRITPGPHTVKLYSDAVYPHVVALRFDSPTAFPEGWVLRRPGARSLPTPPTDVDPIALRLAISDLIDSFGPQYPRGDEYLRRLDPLERQFEAVQGHSGEEADRVTEDLTRLRREALLSNPLLDFERLLLIERSAANLGLPRNWESNSSLPTAGYDNRIVVLSPIHPEGNRQVAAAVYL